MVVTLGQKYNIGENRRLLHDIAIHWGIIEFHEDFLSFI